MKKQLSEMTLEELWKLFPIILREYDPAWPEWYRAEEELLKRNFGDHLYRIRHIGSTSVPGLPAKPTVDILLEAKEETLPETLRELAKKSGYLVMAESTENGYQLDLNKGYTPDGFAEKVFHLHIRYPGDWDEPVFCEYLLKHPECAAKYAELKRALKERFEHDRDGYTNAKTDFIRFWTAEARKKFFPEILTERLKIRSFRKEDSADLYEYLSDPETVAFEPYDVYSKEDAEKETMRRVSDHDFLAVERLSDHKVIGNIYFSKRDFDARELGYVFNRKFWHNGYASEAARAVMDRAFAEENVHRVFAECDPENVFSWKLLERLGMRRERVSLKDHYFRRTAAGKPVWKDSFLYAILKEEWDKRNQ